MQKNHKNENYSIFKTGAGRVIGFEDILLPLFESNEHNCNASIKLSQQHTRRFTVRVESKKVEALELPTTFLLEMGDEFPGAYHTLFTLSEQRLENLLIMKERLKHKLEAHNQVPIQEQVNYDSYSAKFGVKGSPTKADKFAENQVEVSFGTRK